MFVSILKKSENPARISALVSLALVAMFWFGLPLCVQLSLGAAPLTHGMWFGYLAVVLMHLRSACEYVTIQKEEKTYMGGYTTHVEPYVMDYRGGFLIAFANHLVTIGPLSILAGFLWWALVWLVTYLYVT